MKHHFAESQAGQDNSRCDDYAGRSSAIRRFNAALPLIRKFDLRLGPVENAVELSIGLRALDRAIIGMRTSIPANRKALAKFTQEFGETLPVALEKVFQEIAGLTRVGAMALIDLVSSNEEPCPWWKICDQYKSLMDFVCAAPRLRNMRKYIGETGLLFIDMEEAKDHRLAALVNECKLVMASLSLTLFSQEGFDVQLLQERFEKFRWSYIDRYRAAHIQRRTDIKRFTEVVEEAELLLAALKRLDPFPWFGGETSDPLAHQLRSFSDLVLVCDVERLASLDVSPRCPNCNFLLASSLPFETASHFLRYVKRALKSKLAVLLKKASARLVQVKGEANQLEALIRLAQSGPEALDQGFDELASSELNRLAEPLGGRQSRGSIALRDSA
jgi:hypothetical protein